jgi:hypothetical protein
VGNIFSKDHLKTAAIVLVVLTVLYRTPVGDALLPIVTGVKKPAGS